MLRTSLRRCAWIAMVGVICLLAPPALADTCIPTGRFVAYWLDRPYAIGCDMNGVDGAVIFAGERSHVARVFVMRQSWITGDYDNAYVERVETFGQTEDVIFGTTHDGEYFILMKESGEVIKGQAEDGWELILGKYGARDVPTETFWDGYCYNAFGRVIKGLLCVGVVLIAVVGLRRWLRRPGSAWARRQEEARECDEPALVEKGWMWFCLVLSGLGCALALLNIWASELAAILALPVSLMWVLSVSVNWENFRRSLKRLLLIIILLGGVGYAAVLYDELAQLAVGLIMIYLS